MNFAGLRRMTSIFLMFSFMKKRALPKSWNAFFTDMPSAVMRTISRPMRRHRMTLKTRKKKNAQKERKMRKKVRSLPSAPENSSPTAVPTPHQAMSHTSSIICCIRGISWLMMMVKESSCQAYVMRLPMDSRRFFFTLAWYRFGR